MKLDGMNADALRSPPAMLISLNGIGPEFAAVLWSEGALSKLRQSKAGRRLRGAGSDTVAKRIGCARTRGVQRRATRGSRQQCYS